jgi:2-iminobutanoate/2-iminopropanoate deaminase
MTHHREPIDAPGAPAAVGPYVHAVRAGNLVFCSGQLSLDPASGELRGDSFAEQARGCLDNLRAVAEAAGATLGDAVRITVYLTDMAAFAEVNEVYAGYFADAPPARVAIGVAALPKGGKVEMDAVLALES